MTPKLRMFLTRTALLGLKLLYAVILVFTCAFTAIFASSPFVLIFLVVLNKLTKPLMWFGGDYLCLWATASAVIFVPLLVYSIIYRIVQRTKQKKAMAEAIAKAHEKKVQEKK